MHDSYRDYMYNKSKCNQNPLFQTLMYTFVFSNFWDEGKNYPNPTHWEYN